MKVMSKPEMSMVNPSTDKLMSKVDSRYGLVVCASKRARQLVDGEELKNILALGEQYGEVEGRGQQRQIP